MNTHYNGNCNVQTTPFDTSTHVFCSQPGGSAYLVALGNGPSCVYLQVCQTGLRDGDICEHYAINEDTDIGDIFPSQFDEIEEALNEHYMNCNTMATMTDVSIECANAGGSAFLVADGVGDDAVAESLKLCMTGLRYGDICETRFIDANTNVFSLVNDPISRPTCDDIENELELHFGPESCITMATMVDIVVSCSMPGASAWLECDGPTGDSTATTLTWCTQGTASSPDCEKSNVDESTLASLREMNQS